MPWEDVARSSKPLHAQSHRSSMRTVPMSPASSGKYRLWFDQSAMTVPEGAGARVLDGFDALSTATPGPCFSPGLPCLPQTTHASIMLPAWLVCRESTPLVQAFAARQDTGLAPHPGTREGDMRSPSSAAMMMQAVRHPPVLPSQHQSPASHPSEVGAGSNSVREAAAEGAALGSPNICPRTQPCWRGAGGLCVPGAFPRFVGQ